MGTAFIFSNQKWEMNLEEKTSWSVSQSKHLDETGGSDEPESIF